MKVENFSDDLWLGVKGQSNLQIAGSLRNNFRVSLVSLVYRGRETVRDGGTYRLPHPDKLRIL